MKGSAPSRKGGGKGRSAAPIGAGSSQGTRRGVSGRRQAGVVIFDFDGTAHGDEYLTLARGDRVDLLQCGREEDVGWAYGVRCTDGVEGWFPPKYWQALPGQTPVQSSGYKEPSSAHSTGNSGFVVDAGAEKEAAAEDDEDPGQRRRRRPRRSGKGAVARRKERRAAARAALLEAAGSGGDAQEGEDSEATDERDDVVDSECGDEKERALGPLETDGDELQTKSFPTAALPRALREPKDGGTNCQEQGVGASSGTSVTVASPGDERGSDADVAVRTVIIAAPGLEAEAPAEVEGAQAGRDSELDVEPRRSGKTRRRRSGKGAVQRRKERRAAARLAAAEAAGEDAPGEAAGTDGSADSDEGCSSAGEEKVEADDTAKDEECEPKDSSEPSNAGASNGPQSALSATQQQPAIQQPLTSPIPGSTGRVSLDWRRIGTPAAGAGAGRAPDGGASPPRQAGRGGPARAFAQALKKLS